jgi:hypothetical protein
MWPNPFSVKIYTQLHHGKKLPENRDTFAFYKKKLPRVNNRPIGKPSANLVAMINNKTKFGC